MGSAEGARKARAYQIEQFGSIERAAKILGARGGKSGSSGFKEFTDEQRKEYGKRGALKRWAKTEVERLKIHDEN